MSRRDIVVNTLLGCFLVSVFLLPFFLYLLLAAYAFRMFGFGIDYYFPGADKSLVGIVGVFLALSLLSAVQSVRKRDWQSAFLSFAMLPVLASMYLADPHSPFGLHANFWIFGLLPIFVIPEGSGRKRSQFFIAVFAICATIVVSTGLLGPGRLAQIFSDCALAGFVIWLGIDMRQRWSVRKDDLPPNHA